MARSSQSLADEVYVQAAFRVFLGLRFLARVLYKGFGFRF